ncbi:MAG: S8 family serine peptidase [Limisphaerales bacterium]
MALLGGVAGLVSAAPCGPFHVALKEPQARAYTVEAAIARSNLGTPDLWIQAGRLHSTESLEFGSRVVLKTDPTTPLDRLLEGTPLRLKRTVAPGLFVLEAQDAWTALLESEKLGRRPEVEACHPVRRRPFILHSPYAPRPNDPLFVDQWHLEERDPQTAAATAGDLNARVAWASVLGQGVMIAVVDDGMDLVHPDLASNAQAGQPHWNFVDDFEDGSHPGRSPRHGTAVAGLLASSGNNGLGVVGVAPAAGLTSWVIFSAKGGVADEEKLADMFQHRMQEVSVQNHSWGYGVKYQSPLGALEDAAIDNAYRNGRGGRGVVMVRSAGNERATLGNINDDGYAKDLRVITVGAVRKSGRATSYSTPGAPILVAAFSGDPGVELPDGSFTNYPGLTTTDRLGGLGYNSGTEDPDYAREFTGTSAACPLVAGVCALILSTNPEMTVRDVQQALVLASRQIDLADPEVRTNGAGFLVSHNTGYGVPNAGLAVALAGTWSNRPPSETVTVRTNLAVPIPDDGLRVRIIGDDVPPHLRSIPAFPTDAPHPDDLIAPSPLADVGTVAAPPAGDLTGQGVLIECRESNLSAQINRVAEAGARFAVVWENFGGEERRYLRGAELQYVPIPTVSISQASGSDLRSYLRESTGVRAQLSLNAAVFPVAVTNTLICEHVRLRIKTTHPRRSDLRVTLLSPTGTRSVLHHFNRDDEGVLDEWVFTSAQHFFEPTAGVWRVEVGDQQPGSTGKVTSLALSLTGVPIIDQDKDGLADEWETRWFGTLEMPATADPDLDGWNNAQEQVLGLNPLLPDRELRIDIARLDQRWARLSWPSSHNFTYEVLTDGTVAPPTTIQTNIPGGFPETEWCVPCDETPRFFRIRAIPR